MYLTGDADKGFYSIQRTEVENMSTNENKKTTSDSV